MKWSCDAMSILWHTWGVSLMDDYGSIVEWWSARENWRNSEGNPNTSATRNVTWSHRDLTRSFALQTTRLTHWVTARPITLDTEITFIVSPCIFVHLVLFSPNYALIYIIKILSQAVTLVALFTPYRCYNILLVERLLLLLFHRAFLFT